VGEREGGKEGEREREREREREAVRNMQFRYKGGRNQHFRNKTGSH
jgi:hypothetical protein